MAQSTTVSEKTPAVGAVNITIKQGMNVVSFPLYLAPAGIGATAGKITAFTASTITDPTADWSDFLDANDLYVTSDGHKVPLYLRFVSGLAAGRTLRILDNTDTEITIETDDKVSTTAISLVTLKVAAGDRYEIIRGDTIHSLFGDGTATGVDDGISTPKSGNEETGDIVRLYNNSTGARKTFYFNPGVGATGAWVNADAPSVNANDTVICPDTAIIYDRRAATDFRLAVAGTVPAVQRKAVVRNKAYTYLSSFWPKDVALKDSNLHTVVLTGDVLSIFKNGTNAPWDGYRYDTANGWRNTFTNRPAGDVIIPAGTGYIIQRASSKTDTAGTELTQPLPYDPNL